MERHPSTIDWSFIVFLSGLFTLLGGAAVLVVLFVHPESRADTPHTILAQPAIIEVQESEKTPAELTRQYRREMQVLVNSVSSTTVPLNSLLRNLEQQLLTIRVPLTYRDEHLRLFLFIQRARANSGQMSEAAILTELKDQFTVLLQTLTE